MSSHSPAHLQRSSWTAGRSASCRPRDGIVIRGSSRLLALRPRLVLGNTGLDETSNDRNGNPLLRREMDAPRGLVESRNLLPKLPPESGRGTEETEVVRERGEAHEHALVLVRRHLVADPFRGLRGGRLDHTPKGLQRLPLLRGQRRQVGVDALRSGASLSRHERGKNRFTIKESQPRSRHRPVGDSLAPPRLRPTRANRVTSGGSETPRSIARSTSPLQMRLASRSASRGGNVVYRSRRMSRPIPP